jgi:hypothetical protein
MKLTLVLTGVAVLLGAVVYWFVAGRAVTPSPTAATTGDNAQVVTLPDLEPLLDRSAAPSGQAGATLRDVLDFARRHRADINTRSVEPDIADELMAMLAGWAATARGGSADVDSRLPLDRSADGDFRVSLDIISAAAIDRVVDHREAGEGDRAAVIAASVATLGRRLFEDNERYLPRYEGLKQMQSGLNLLGDIQQRASRGDVDEITSVHTEPADAWRRGVSTVMAVWRDKAAVFIRPDPHVGDLMQMARHDEDISFRLMGTLELGRARFTADTAQTVRAVEAALREAQDSDDPRIVEAANTAMSMTSAQDHF